MLIREELVTGSRTSDTGVRNAMLKALYEVISKAGSNMSEASRASVLSLIDADVDENAGAAGASLLLPLRFFLAGDSSLGFAAILASSGPGSLG